MSLLGDRSHLMATGWLTGPTRPATWKYTCLRSYRPKVSGRFPTLARADGALMVAEVRPGRDSFGVGSVEQVPERRMSQSIYTAPYDVFLDGQRIIMAAVKPQAIHAPLTLITNWTAELKK